MLIQNLHLSLIITFLCQFDFFNNNKALVKRLLHINSNFLKTYKYEMHFDKWGYFSLDVNKFI